ncbi:hypothetical protein [Rhodopila sp.]|uniref:hypothetical protein n=1 Tax=Rhodopila sp. TaxID=2480087 RepID=UPI003D1337E8
MIAEIGVNEMRNNIGDPDRDQFKQLRRVADAAEALQASTFTTPGGVLCVPPGIAQDAFVEAIAAYRLFKEVAESEIADEEEALTIRVVGALGEQAVLAELRRREWIATDLNHPVKNARDFDISAQKGARSVRINVKTCRPAAGHARIRACKKGAVVVPELSNSDYIIIVRMGKAKHDFYIMPKHVVFQECLDRQTSNVQKGRKPDGPFNMSWNDNSANPGE